MKLLVYFLCFSNIIFSQSICDLKTRFNTYLNFNGSLNQCVSFTENSVVIKRDGKAEYTVYEGEQEILTALLKTKKPSEFMYFIIPNSLLMQTASLPLTSLHLDGLSSPLANYVYLPSVCLS